VRREFGDGFKAWVDVLERSAMHARRGDQEVLSSGAGDIGDRQAALVLRIPQVLPGGGRLVEFVGIVGECGAAVHEPDPVRLVAVHGRLVDVVQIGNARGVERYDEVFRLGLLNDLDVHIGDVDARLAAGSPQPRHGLDRASKDEVDTGAGALLKRGRRAGTCVIRKRAAENRDDQIVGGCP
jgi:hypothetical protein